MSQSGGINSLSATNQAGLVTALGGDGAMEAMSIKETRSHRSQAGYRSNHMERTVSQTLSNKQTNT